MEVILLSGFLLFLVIPAFLVISEKVYLKYSVHRICEMAETSVMSSVMDINTGEFSGGRLVFADDGEIEKRTSELLMMNSFENMEILEYSVSYHQSGEICPSGNSSGHDFIHLLMKVSLERLNDREPVEFWVHRDIEFPYDR